MSYNRVKSCEAIGRAWYRRARGGVLIALLAAVGATGCGDPVGIDANYETATASVSLYRLNGTAPERPAGVLLASVPQAVRLTADYSFDFAVDFDASGGARLIPLQRIASPVVLTPNRAVGFQRAADDFDSLLRAPNSGYNFDEDLPVTTGDVGFIESRNHPFCANIFFAYSFTIYAKFVVEAVDPAAGTVRLKIMVDPNCGFRGLETGTPTR